MSPLFAFDDVAVRYGEISVLDGVTATIADGGAITCLLGPSGSGKSTLLRLCNRLAVATEGTVTFRGRNITTIDPLEHRRRVGMVFQRPTLFAGTVRDNLRVADPDATEDDMHEALEWAQLGTDMLGRTGARLSGGEAQRVCLARTLITRPEVLLMDEPTSALDPGATTELERLGQGLARFGVPVLWVTHDVAQSGRIADHRIVLTDGRLAAELEIERFLAGENDEHDHNSGLEHGESTDGPG